MDTRYQFIVKLSTSKDAYRFLPGLLREWKYDVNNQNFRRVNNGNLEFISKQQITEAHKKKLLKFKVLGIKEIKESIRER